MIYFQFSVAVTSDHCELKWNKMRVHRANLGRLKKRIRKYNRTTYKNKKQHIEQAQHVPDLMETDALQQVGPPSIDDEIYQTYLNQINTNCISIVVRQEKLKPTKDDPIIKSNPNRDIVRLINSGAVWECSLHKVFISQSITRYSIYTNEDGTAFCCLSRSFERHTHSFS